MFDQDEMKKRLSSDGLFIAIASACVYLVAFNFENGYAQYWGIPSTLITVTTDTLLSIFPKVFPLMIFLYWLINMAPHCIRLIDDKAKNKMYRSFGFVVVPSLFVFLISWVITFDFIISAKISLGVAALLLTIFLIDYFIEKRRSADLPEKPKKPYQPDGRMSLFAIIILLFSTLPMLSKNWGYKIANDEKGVLFQMATDYALIRKYGDILVTVKIDRLTGKAVNDLQILHLDKIDKIGFEMKSLKEEKTNTAELTNTHPSPEQSTPPTSSQNPSAAP